MTDLFSPFVVADLGYAPPLVCGFGTSAEDYCGEPATWHIFFDAQLHNGIDCDHHRAAVLGRHVFYAEHPYDPICSMPGAGYDEENNRCFIPDDEEFLTSEADLPWFDDANR